MFSLRSVSKSSSPAVVAGVACVVAMIALTGCGDDEPKSPALPSMEVPSLKPLPTPDRPSTAPSPKSTTTRVESQDSPASDGPTPTGASKSEPRIELEIGDCVNASPTGNLVKASCTAPHRGEVAAEGTVPESTNPSSPTYKQDVNAQCERLLVQVHGRQDNPNALAFLAYHPSAASWTNDNDRKLQCIIISKDYADLTAPLK